MIKIISISTEPVKLIFNDINKLNQEKQNLPVSKENPSPRFGEKLPSHFRILFDNISSNKTLKSDISDKNNILLLSPRRGYVQSRSKSPLPRFPINQNSRTEKNAIFPETVTISSKIVIICH